MTTESTAASGEQSGRSLPALPLILALGGGILQLVSCGTRFVGVGVALGLAVSIAAVVSGHIVLSRIRRGALRGRGFARLGLAAAYLSVLSIPVVGYGIIILYNGICGGGLLSR
jgi:hypothetical protein